MPIDRSFSLTCGLWMISPVRKTLRSGNALARLVRVVDGAVDAVAESEFAREVHRQPSRAIGEVVGLDLLDDRAVIVVGEHAGDGMLQVEALAEDQRRHEIGISAESAELAEEPRAIREFWV